MNSGFLIGNKNGVAYFNARFLSENLVFIVIFTSLQNDFFKGE